MSAQSSHSKVETALERAAGAGASSAFTVRLDQQARCEAEFADRFPRGPFSGVPITIKDNFDLAGHPTTAGSKLLADAAPAKRDAVVVDRLRRAGFVILGRTNMTEFAFSGLGLNPHFGTPSNPAFKDEHRIPGGSSSGAAVSVALGIGPAAVGSDTGGSIRIPAALCGLTGFKPTACAVSREGMLPLSPSLDSVGVIAHSVADCAALFDVIRDLPGQARPIAAPRRIRLGVVESYVQENLEPVVEGAFRSALAQLEAAGIGVERLALSRLCEIPEMMRETTFAGAEAAAWHAPYFAAGRTSEYDPRVAIRIEAGNEMRAPAYVRLLEWRRALIEAVTAETEGLDALVWPTVPFIAPPIAGLADDAAYHRTNMLALRNSTVANLLDGCAISIPCPVEGAPVGLTLAAPHGRDDRLLSVSATVQSLLKVM